jgi:hypothetical protein
MNLLKRIPLASIVFTLYTLTTSIVLILDNITLDAYGEGILKVGIACGVIGYVRNQAGHGISR